MSAQPLTAGPVASLTRGSSPRLPAHVVFKTFAHETVMLNLQSGLYHRLTPVGDRMLKVLDGERTVGAAVERLSGELKDASQAQIEGDLLAFCEDLLERGLIELSPDGRRG